MTWSSAGGRLLPLRSSGYDRRLSWCGYLPSVIEHVAVVVHGSDRDPVGLLRAFSRWSDRDRVALVAPLFPGDVAGHGGMDGYKALVGDGIRYDGALQAIVEEASVEHRCATERVLLFGFSGGAQFAHRFALVHPTAVAALSIAAPGNVTRLARDRPWWPGIQDFGSTFEAEIDLEALRRVRVHAVVGGDDDGRDVIRIDRGSPRWREGANDAGSTRVERLAALVSDWRAHGVAVDHEVVPGVAHDVEPLAAAAVRFFSQTLGRLPSANDDETDTV